MLASSRRIHPGLLPALGLAWVVTAVCAALTARDFQPYALLYLPFGWDLVLSPAASSEVRSAGALWNLALAASIPPLAYLALGLVLLRVLRISSRGAERLALGWLVGTGSASLLILGLRSLDVPVPLAALGLAAAVAGALELRSRHGEHRETTPSTRSRAAAVIDAAAIATGIFAIASALGPEVSWDALEYHLPIAQAWSEGPIRPLPGVLDAELRTAVDLLYIPAVAAGAPDAAAVITACFALALAALVRSEVARSGARAAAAWSGLLTLLAPLVLTQAPSCYTDLAVGAYGFAALLAAHRWNRGGEACLSGQRGEARLLVLAALFAAFAANAKLHAAVLVPAVGALLLIGGRPPRLRSLGGFALLAGALILPWFIKAALTTGNPLFPLFGDRFGWGDFSGAHIELRRERLAHDLPPDLRHLPAYLFELAFGGHPYLGGLLGPLPLALAPLALRRPDRAAAALMLIWLLLFALLFTHAPALRFGTPLLPFVAVVAATGGDALARSGRRMAIALALICAGVAVFQAASAVGAWAPRLAAMRAPRPYERAVWPAEETLREMVAQARPVVAIPMGAVLWMPKPVYLMIAERNGEIFFGRDTPRHVLEVFEKRGVHSLVLQVALPVPADGSVRNPTFDAWIRRGWLRRREDVKPRPAWPGSSWVLLEVVSSLPPL